MPKRTGRRCVQNSHSIKKILRRNGGNVNCSKNKRKKALHPGKEKSGNNTPAIRRAAREARRNPEPDAMETDDKAKKKEPAATAARREARQAIGKQLRGEELAKRRGLSLQMGGGGLDDDVSVEAPDDEGPSASAVAGKALASAPSGQKAYQRELSKVLEAADVLVEVLDVRDPMGCRCKALEDAVMQRWESKRVVLLLNKCDLVPPDVVQKWVTYLRQYFPTLPFKASTQNQAKGLGSSRGGVLEKSGFGGSGGGGGASAYGADSLLQLLKNYSRSLNIKTAITVGIIGYPNVGKSSVINSLKRARAVNVGSTPGLTTHAQTVSLDKKVKLMDCPGIVFAKAKNADEEADVLLRNCVRVERMADPLVPVAAILRRVPAAQLRDLYGLEAWNGTDATEFLTLVALKRGHLRKGGAVDQEAAARTVLQDWNGGLIKYHTPPPQSNSAVTIVSALAAEFDAAQQEAARVEQPGASQPPAAFQFAPVGSSGAAAAAPLAARGAGAAGGAAGGGFGGAFGASKPPQQQQQQQAAASSMRVEGEEEEGDDDDDDEGGLLVAADKQKRAPKLTRKEMTHAKQARKQDLRDEADQYNPQANRTIAKKQKAQQRKQRRSSLSRLLAANA